MGKSQHSSRRILSSALIWLVAILLVALFLRVYRLEFLPYGPYYDEAANGLLAALTFALEKKYDKKLKKTVLQRDGYAAIFDAIAEHLQSPEVSITNETDDANSLLDHLVASDSQTLKLATAEAMEWLSYARRFVRPE